MAPKMWIRSQNKAKTPAVGTIYSAMEAMLKESMDAEPLGLAIADVIYSEQLFFPSLDRISDDFKTFRTEVVLEDHF